MSFIQITDLHFVAGDADLYGYSPRTRLQEGIKLINREHKTEKFVLATGDLAEAGEIEAYRTLKDVLRQCQIPVHLMLGNHDDRQSFLSVFNETPVIEGGFVQFRIDDGSVRILCLDSLSNNPGEVSGRLCKIRLSWLDKELSAAHGKKKIIVACHHPPFDTGIKVMDQWGLVERDELWEVFQTRQPNLFVFGHVHRPISGFWRGIPIHSQRGFHHQVFLDFEEKNRLVMTNELADFSIFRAYEDSIQIFGRSVGGELQAFEVDY